MGFLDLPVVVLFEPKPVNPEFWLLLEPKPPKPPPPPKDMLIRDINRSRKLVCAFVRAETDSAGFRRCCDKVVEKKKRAHCL